VTFTLQLSERINLNNLNLIVRAIDMQEFNVIIEEGEDGYLISEVVELPGCHTQAKTIDQLIKRTKEAIELCLEAGQKPEEKFVGLQKVRVKAV